MEPQVRHAHSFVFYTLHRARTNFHCLKCEFVTTYMLESVAGLPSEFSAVGFITNYFPAGTTDVDESYTFAYR